MWDSRRIKRIDIELTSFCNIACLGCSREHSRFREDYLNKDMISFETIQKRFRKEDWPSLVGVNFCGSVDEPTTHPEFFKIVEFFQRWGVYINIATNGSIKTEQWWTKLGNMLAGTRHMVHWGIDGIDEVSEQYRVGSKFKKVQKNFRAYNAAGGKSTWQFIVMKHNEHQLPLLEETAKAEGFVTTRVIYSNRKHNKSRLNEVEYIKPKKEELEEVQCHYLHEGYLFINHKGDVIPCCYMNNEHLETSSPNYRHSSIPGRRKYVEMWMEHGGQLATNMKYNEIKDVLEGDFFDAVAESWTQKPLLDRCEHFCKKKKTSLFKKKVLVEDENA